MQRTHPEGRTSGPRRAVVACLAVGMLISLSSPLSRGRAQTTVPTSSFGIRPGLVARPPFSLQGSPVAVFLPLIQRVPVKTAFLPLTANRYRLPSVFGVQMQAVSDAQGLREALDMGAYWVRGLPFSWRDIEPVRTEPPTYRWNRVDETSLLAAAQNGLRFIGVVHFTPSWAQALPGVACGPIHPNALDEFAQFLQALVSRYGRAPYNVRDWELWNEPDVDPSVVSPDSGFGCWGDKDDAYYGGGYYAQMLAVAYPAIKGVDPDARVSVGGLLLDCDPRNPPSGKDCSPAKFLEGILREGGGAYFDLVAFHTYTYYWGSLGDYSNPNWPGSTTAIPEKVDFLREVLAQYGFADKPLINTEASQQCYLAWDDCFETQAMYVARAYAEALALDLKAQVYYQMIDSWRNVGLLLPDLAKKPVYYGYATAASFLASVQYESLVTGYGVGVAGYTFRGPGSGFLDVIWSADGSPCQVALPAGAQAYDRYGQSLGPSATITLGRSPVYVQRP